MNNYIKNLAQLVEDHVARLPLPAEPAGLYAPITYIMEDGGKRMRPMLCLLVAGAFADSAQRAINAAMAIEVFHNFTLLHDDIMDSAPTRRGRDTVHTKWDNNTAILSGDAMMIFAYTLLAKSANFNAIFPVFSASSIEVCEGQQMDMDFETRGEVAMSEYMEMIRLKTSSLMTAAAVMGAIEGGASVSDVQSIERFANLLGLAFQIQDDLLDTFGSPETFGKKIGGDIAEGKKTFLMITTFERCTPGEREGLLCNKDYDTVRALYEKYDVQSVAQGKIEELYNQAIESLSQVRDGDTSQIEAYAQIILRREK